MSYQPRVHLTLGLALCAVTLTGQTQVDLKTQSKHVDFTQSAATAPVKAGVTPPSNCAVGDLFYDTNEAAGQNLYACTSSNTWTLLGGGGLMAQKLGVGNPNGSQTCSAPNTATRTLYFDTVAFETWQCVAANTWKKILDTNGSGPVVLSGTFNPTDLTAPSTSGQGAMQFGDNGLEYFPFNGSLSRTVVPRTCSSPDVVSAIAANGTVACTPPSAVRALETQTANIDSVASGNLLAAAPAGMYRVSAYIHTTAPEGAACTITVDIGYTYNGGSKTLSVVSSHNLNSDEAASEGIRVIQVDNSTNIVRSLTDSCTRSAYLYDYTIALERMN